MNPLRRIRRPLDLALGAFAFVFALPSLGYAFARDQALFFYIGREWLHGAIPYKDAYDFKPPGIFALNALAIAVLGAHMWSIRLVDILLVLLMGWLVSRAVDRDGEPAHGEVGAIVLMTTAYYFTTLAFEDTAQTEVGESVALLASYVVAKRDPSLRRAAFVSGVLLAVAVFFKFPAPVIGVVTTGVILVRGWNAASSRRQAAASLLRVVALQAAGALSVVAVVTGYFAAHGALSAAIEMLFLHLWDYHAHIRVPPDTAAIAFGANLRVPWNWLLFGAWLLAVAQAASRGARANLISAATAAVLLVLAIVQIVLQRRYLAYYWTVTAPFACLCGAHGIAELARTRRRGALAAVAYMTAFGFAAAPDWRPPYRTHVRLFAEYLAGRIGRWEYLAPFGDFRMQERISGLIRQQARPGDQLMARGYEPAFYALSGLRCPSRFAVEVPFMSEGMTYKRDEWRAEHERDTWAARVRFVVAFDFAAEDIRAIEDRGYHETAKEGPYVLLERND